MTAVEVQFVALEPTVQRVVELHCFRSVSCAFCQTRRKEYCADNGCLALPGTLPEDLSWAHSYSRDLVRGLVELGECSFVLH